jgi:hypothetical protein
VIRAFGAHCQQQTSRLRASDIIRSAY